MENITSFTPLDNFSVADNSTTTAAQEPFPQGSNVIDPDIVRFLPDYLSAYWLDTTYLWILTIIGLVGNSLSIITILHIVPLTSSSLYVVFLAIMDSLSLIVKLIYQQVTKYDIGIGNGGCRALLYLGNTSVMTANWLVVAMTAERLVAIWFPLRVSEISTKNKACILYCSLIVVFLGINVCYLFMFHETYDPVTYFACLPIPEYQEFVYNVFNWMDASFYALIPCLLLLILNTLIVVGTWLSTRTQRKLTQNQDQINEKRKQQNQITMMLVTVSVIFLVLTMPNGIYFMTTGSWVPKTNEEYATKILVERVVLFFSDCNHAVNFFLYFLSGRRFRQMFMKTCVPRCLRRGRPESVYVANGSSVSGTRVTGLTSVSETISKP